MALNVKSKALPFLDAPPKVNTVARPGSGAFAVSLIYVNYAYTGWNAATYLIDEVEEPARNLPKILIVGTGLVMLSYVLLNYVFLSVAPIEAMQGKIEIGMIAAEYAFGEAGGRAMGITLSLLLISTSPRSLKRSKATA